MSFPIRLTLPISLYKVLQEKEVAYLRCALEQARGNHAAAARLLMINRTTLIAKLCKNDLLDYSKALRL